MRDIKPIRVIRIIQITYPSQESYEEDRAHWALPANGSKSFGASSPRFECATLPSETIGDPQAFISAPSERAGTTHPAGQGWPFEEEPEAIPVDFEPCARDGRHHLTQRHAESECPARDEADELEPYPDAEPEFGFSLSPDANDASPFGAGF